MASCWRLQGSARDGWVIGLCTLLTFAIFSFDLVTPSDNVSIGFAYDSVIFLTFLVRYRRLQFFYAAVASALVVIGCFFPVPGVDEAPVFFANRVLAVGSLWLIACLIESRTRAEAALLKALETAESASGTKSRFLASMSHELRAPLTGILGFSEILKSQMLGPIGNPRYVDYACHIHESGEHMLSLINDVLDISKIEAGKMELELEWLNVATLFDHVLDMLAGRAEDAGLTLVTDVPASLQLRADVRAVTQMMLNLLSNAIKFTPEGGAIVLAATVTAQGGVTLSVRDTGVGLSHEAITRLMRPFEQADNRYSITQKGSGLGLSLVKGLMGLHDGQVTVDSRVGSGSTFSLHFPPPPPSLPSPSAVPDGAGAPTATARA